MIDWARVEELRDEVGAEDFEEVVELFLEEVDEMISRLTDTPDPSTYEADLHFLKGSGLNLGFADFCALCADGERSAMNGDTDSIDISQVITAYHASRAAFLERLGAQQAA